MAQDLRVASYDAGLTRRGPGLLLRDLLRGEDAQIAAVVQVIAAADADILLLTGIDHDHGHAALAALAARLAAAGAAYPHRFALMPNTGMPSGHDLDGDGRRGQPEDAQGYGWFPGEGGMAILSRHPIIADAAVDFSDLLWRDLPGATLPRRRDGGVFPSAEAMAVQRLSSTGHWVVPVALPGGARLTLLAWRATPPVFDGPEDRNGHRNHDEAVLWLRFLDGVLSQSPPEGPVVVIGNANLDPADGDGRPAALRALLDHPRLQDPRPRSPGGLAAADAGHRGDPALDTVDWGGEVGNLRVTHVLPSVDVAVRDAGVLWPVPDGGPLAEAVAAASPHRLVWVDLRLSPGAPEGARRGDAIGITVAATAGAAR